MAVRTRKNVTRDDAKRLKKRGGAGGAGNAGGGRLEDRIAAFAAVLVLVEKLGALPEAWNLPADARLLSVHRQPDEDIDDVVVRTSSPGRVMIQAKRTLRCSASADSDFAEALEQCVKAYHTAVREGRPLDPQCDRLVIATDRGGSAPVRETLPHILASYRLDSGLSELTDAIDRNDGTPDAAQTAAANKLVGHVTRLWESICGTPPVAADLRPFWCLLRFWEFDEQHYGERAGDLLRGTVLAGPTKAAAVWKCLESEERGYSVLRAGADRPGLESFVRNDLGFRLAGRPDLKAAVRQIRDHSIATWKALEKHSVIPVGGGEVRIDRVLSQAAKSAAMTGSVAIIGEPGAGKTGVLHGLVRTLPEDAETWCLMAAEELPTVPAGHTPFDVLAAWPDPPAGTPLTLMIDGLDAARDEEPRRPLRNLIERVRREDPRWHVVATVRTFDLKHGAGWQELFPGCPPAGPSPDRDLAGTAHIVVPGLTDSDLDSAAGQSDGLAHLIAAAREEDETGALLRLLREPFNLRLAGTLAGDRAADVRAVRSRGGLLDSYWKYRTVRAGRGASAEERTRTVRVICSAMVERGSLSLPASAADAAPPNGLEALREDGVLRGSAGDPVAFAHNILHDDAVSRTVLEDEPGALANRVGTDPLKYLALAPSLERYWERVWEQDLTREEYWRRARALESAEGVTALVKITAPSLAADRLAVEGDYRLLLDTVEEGNEAAGEVCRHLIGGIAASGRIGGYGVPVVFQGVPEPWCRFLRDLIGCPPPIGCVRAAGRLMRLLKDRESQMSVPQRCHLHAAAVAAVRWCDRQDADVRGTLLPIAAETVCEMAATNPAVTADILRELAVPPRDRAAARAIDWGVMRNLEYLTVLPAFPDLLHALTAAVLNRTRRGGQDVDVDAAGGHLVHQFPKLFDVVGPPAARAIVAAAEAAYEDAVDRYRIRPPGGTGGGVGGPDGEIAFRGRSVPHRPDASELWDDLKAGRRADRVLDALEEHLEKLAAAARIGEIMAWLDELAACEPRAVVWRRVLEVAAKHPVALGLLCVDLLRSELVLLGAETTAPAARAVDALTPYLTDERRTELAAAFRSLPDEWPADRGWRDEDGSTPAMRRRSRLLDALDADRRSPAVPPRGEGTSARVQLARPRETPATARLIDAGLDPDDPAVAAARPVLDAAAAFAMTSYSCGGGKEGQDAPPVPWEVVEAVDGLRRADVPDTLRRYAFGLLVRACSRIVRTAGAPSGRHFQLVKEVLLEAAGQTVDFTPQEIESFERSPVYPGDNPAITAALDIPELIAAEPDSDREADRDLLDAVERLATHPSAMVRNGAVGNLVVLLRHRPRRFWTLADAIGRQEVSPRVAVTALEYPLKNRREAGTTEEGVATSSVEIAARLLDRFPPADGESAGSIKNLRATAFGMLLCAYADGDRSASTRYCSELTTNPALDPQTVHASPDLFRDNLRLVVGGRHLTDGPFAAWVDALWSVFTTLSTSVADALARDEEAEQTQWLEALRSLTAVAAEEVGREIYRPELKPIPAPASLKRLFGVSRTLLRRLADVPDDQIAEGVAAIAEAWLPVRPKPALQIMAQLAANGSGWSDQSDAAERVARSVRSVLAEHRGVVRDEEAACRHLIALFEAFMDWPRVRHLAGRIGRELR